jgi:hypothetical protein
MDWAKLTGEPVLLCKLQKLLTGRVPMWVQRWIFERNTAKYDFILTNVKGSDEGLTFKTQSSTHEVQNLMFWISGSPNVGSAAFSTHKGMTQLNLMVDGNMVQCPGVLADFYIAELNRLVAAVETQ